MQTSRFQLGLMATLAVGLGFSLSSSDAIGYPAAAVSTGSNPSWDSAGRLTGYSSVVTLVTAPADQDAMVTDIHLGTDYQVQQVKLVLDDGRLVGDYRVRDTAGGDVVRAMVTGIRVPAGRSLILEWSSPYTVRYNVSGYYGQP